MFKKFIRWILPLLVLLLFAMCLALSPVLSTHAAGPHVPVQHTTTHQDTAPKLFWRP